jgi:glycosyltransferase involved in cell wall biosynthesis
VSFYGFVEGKKKDELLRKCHLCVSPTRNEAFGLVILEMFSYGIPVLATKEGAIPSMVDGKTGALVDDKKELSDT